MFDKRRVGSAIIIASLVTCGACVRHGEPAWTGSIIDSNGVRIVTNPDVGLWPRGTKPTVTTIFRAGGATDDPHYQFVDVSSIARRGDGHVFALDRKEQHVQEYDASGVWVRTIGRPGSGPGELSDGVDAIWLGAGDTLMIVDISAQRVSRFDRDGQPAGSFPIPMSGGIAYEWRTDAMGRVLHALVTFGARGATAELIVARDPHGGVKDTLMALPFRESVEMGASGPVLTIFAPEAMWDVGHDGTLLSAVSDEYRITRYDPAGHVTQVFNYPATNHTLGDGDRDVYREATLRLWEGRMPSRFHGALRQNARFHEVYPAFAALRSGPIGTVWVQRFRRADQIPGAERATLDAEHDFGAPDWDIFNSDGQYLGVVTLPERFSPVLFIEQEIYGVQRDELDVQTVLGLRIGGLDLPARP